MSHKMGSGGGCKQSWWSWICNCKFKNWWSCAKSWSGSDFSETTSNFWIHVPGSWWFFKSSKCQCYYIQHSPTHTRSDVLWNDKMWSSRTAWWSSWFVQEWQPFPSETTRFKNIAEQWCWCDDEGAIRDGGRLGYFIHLNLLQLCQ